MDPLRGFNDREAQNIDMETFCVDRYEFPNKKEPCLGSTQPGLKPVRLVSELESVSVPKRNGREPAKGRVVTAFRSGIGRSLELQCLESFQRSCIGCASWSFLGM